MSDVVDVSTDYRFAPIPEDLVYSEMTDKAVRVYAVLMRHGLDPSTCYPSHGRIGELIGAAGRSIQRPLRELEEAGWITRVPRFDTRGDRTSDGFHVRVSSAGTAHESADPSAHDSAVNDSPLNDPSNEGISDAQTPDLADAHRLCDVLADLIEANGSKRPNVTETWVRDMDRMLRLDDRTPERVENCIRWCQADEFWRANILSPSKLRAKFDQLRLQAKARGVRNGASRPAIMGDETRDQPATVRTW